MIVAPRSLRSWSTVDLPLPMLPVRPTRSMACTVREDCAAKVGPSRRRGKENRLHHGRKHTYVWLSHGRITGDAVTIEQRREDEDGIGASSGYAALVRDQLRLLGEDPEREG